MVSFEFSLGPTCDAVEQSNAGQANRFVSLFGKTAKKEQID